MSSESIKVDEFSELYKFLKVNKRISFQDVKNNSVLKNISSYIDELLTESQLEWEGDKSQPVKDLGINFKSILRKCDLCGNKPIRYEHRIWNTINRKRIVIGSECAKEFGDELQGHLIGELRNSKKAVKRLYLEENIPGLRSYIDSGWKYTRKLEMIIPLTLETKWKNIHNEMVYLYNEYITDKRKDYLFIKQSWQEKLSLEKEISSFIKHNKNKDYASNIRIHEWLLQNGKHDVIKMIQEDKGFLKWRTIHRIYEINLMKQTLNSLNEAINKFNIRIIRFNEGSRKVNIRFTRKQNRELVCTVSYEKLIMEFGGLLFENNNKLIQFDFKDILTEAKLPLSEKGQLLSFFTEKIKGIILIDDYEYDNETAFRLREKYYLIDIDRLTSRLKFYYLEDIKIDYFKLLTDLSSKVLSKKRFKEHVEFKKEVASRMGI